MKKDTASQEAQILAYLQSGHRISPLEALSKFGCLRLGARCWNLKHKNGHNIVTEMIEDPKTGKRYASYFIPGLAKPKRERSLKGKGVADYSRAILGQPESSIQVQQTLF